MRQPPDTKAPDNDGHDSAAPAVAADLLAVVAALRQRVAVLETAPARRRRRRSVAGLAGAAAFAVLAGGSLVYGQDAAKGIADALFISAAGRVGIGTSDPRARLHVAGDVAAESQVLTGTLKDGKPNLEEKTSGLKIAGKHSLEFGDGVADKNVYAGQIGYGIWDDALDIVGAGKNFNDRKITLWAEGGAVVHGGIHARTLSLSGNLNEGKLDPNKDTSVLKIFGKHSLEFGEGVADKNVYAGQIGYGIWDDALDIVGAGKNFNDRKITLWAEGGAVVHGSIKASGMVEGNMKVVYQRNDEEVSSYPKPNWRYHMSLTAPVYGGKSKAIPSEILDALCGTRDGCEVRLGMTQWGNDTQTQTASRHALLYYSKEKKRWRVSRGEMDIEGQIGDGKAKDLIDPWGTCLLTEATYDKYQKGEASKSDLQLVVLDGYKNPNRTCELTLIP